MTDQPSGHRFLEFAFLCDAANDKGGLNALGIGTSLVYVERLPVVHRLTLVLRVAWMGGPAGPAPKHLEVSVTGPSGTQLAAIRGGFEIDPNDPAHTAHPEIAVGANLVFPLTMALAEMGVHQVEITFEGDTYPAILFKVVPNTDL